MLNPSTADENVDDPTIRRVTAFARRDGYGGIFVLNLYAFRQRDPDSLWTADDPVGPDTDKWLRAGLAAHGRVVAVAWGADVGPRADRPAEVLRMIAELGGVPHCWGVTKSGQPRHPLYLRGDSPLVPYTQEPA